MSASAKKLWLIAYDIRDPQRLREIHRYLKKRGAHLQYSVFAVECNDFQMRDLLADLALTIDNTQDDVRAYHIPAHCKVWLLGGQTLPKGIELHGTKVMKLLKMHNHDYGLFE